MNASHAICFAAAFMLCGCVTEPQSAVDWESLNYAQSKTPSDDTCSDNVYDCPVGGHTHSHSGHGHR